MTPATDNDVEPDVEIALDIADPDALVQLWEALGELAADMWLDGRLAMHDNGTHGD